VDSDILYNYVNRALLSIKSAVWLDVYGVKAYCGWLGWCTLCLKKRTPITYWNNSNKLHL